MEVLWIILNDIRHAELISEDKNLLSCTWECLSTLFSGFVLLHGNITLDSIRTDTRSDGLLAMVNPGAILWAPREYALFHLLESGLSESLLWCCLQHAPVDESFLWRRWLYVIWNEVAQLLRTGKMNRPAFK